MNILTYIEELIAQGYSEENAEHCADAVYNTDQGCYDMEDDFSF